MLSESNTWMCPFKQQRAFDTVKKRRHSYKYVKVAVLLNALNSYTAVPTDRDRVTHCGSKCHLNQSPSYQQAKGGQ